jgi:hypothetical protein
MRNVKKRHSRGIKKYEVQICEKLETAVTLFQGIPG